MHRFPIRTAQNRIKQIQPPTVRPPLATFDAPTRRMKIAREANRCRPDRAERCSGTSRRHCRSGVTLFLDPAYSVQSKIHGEVLSCRSCISWSKNKPPRTPRAQRNCTPSPSVTSVLSVAESPMHRFPICTPQNRTKQIQRPTVRPLLAAFDAPTRMMKIARAANDVGRTERSDVPARHGAIAGAASRCSWIRPTWFKEQYTEKYFRIVRVFRGQKTSRRGHREHRGIAHQSPP
ncbi:hypothetical protein FHS27_003916 [Rhodopirellula rubra]|uniref:Uncharacterized protein n=1 Tax=Aporhodopirellula rubra TaxID=980271 RepID=A0A7W5H748_9BACT|nr:hypothetical protein [Aporhodopirellula rubra]